MKSFSKNFYGILLCLLIATPAWFLGKTLPLVGAPVFAIFIGMIVNTFYKDRAKTGAGIKFTSKYILQFAVILLGFGLNLSQVLMVGTTSLPIILSTITTSLLCAWLLQKKFNLDSNTATLVGVGSSICGGSAIAATAPVIKADEEEIAKAISVIFLFNILAALIFPTLGDLIGLSNNGFSVFAGTAVNDTSSVTATATTWDSIHNSNTLEGATIVKLTRTLAIIPITLGLSFYQIYKQKQQGASSHEKVSIKKVFPIFILFFVLASILTTFLTKNRINTDIFHYFKILSKFCIVMAMSAIGLNTDIIKLIKTGGQAIFLGGSCWIAITLVDLLMQRFLNLW
ncbi:YeiH family protein [Filifactor alocis]